jgi:hypothetical protein
LISALAIELAFESAETLHARGFGTRAAWAFVGGGFAIGTLIYYRAALFLEKKGAAVRYRTRFREFAQQRKREGAREPIELLSRSDLLRHLPPQEIHQLLPLIKVQDAAARKTLFNPGDRADALYIVAKGEVDILGEADPGSHEARHIAVWMWDRPSARWHCFLAEHGPRRRVLRLIASCS